MNNITYKGVSIVLIILGGILFLLPTFFDTWPNKKIQLGLDLQGGMHLVLEVQNNETVKVEVDRIIQDLKKEFRNDDTKITHHGIDRLKDNSIVVKVKGEKDKDSFEALLTKRYPGMILDKTKELDDNIFQFKFALPDHEITRIKRMSTEQALETIRNRIDQFGVKEPDIRIQGGNRILLQLPGIEDPERAKKLIGDTAQLTFQMVVRQLNVGEEKTSSPPIGAQLLYQERTNDATGTSTRFPYWVKKRVLLDGSLLTDARVEFDQNNFPQVGIAFNKKGARIFERTTGENTGKRLAIVLDKKIYSAPTIQDRISGGRAVITGQFTLDEANDLAIALRAGSLPAPVEIIEERTVGPTLGYDSIKTGLLSMLVGGCLVILFMMIYYKIAGLIADFALIVNIILIGGGLALFGATLTLPGIAGIILTIGMAVDANVIIFERIREEYRSGKTALASVHDGYDRAALTILDANVTTLIAAAVLYQFGTGPVKGFAVTLCLGIVASLFTSLVVSKSIFDIVLKNRQSTKLSI